MTLRRCGWMPWALIESDRVLRANKEGNDSKVICIKPYHNISLS